jgi:hypothetical protein
MLRTQDIIVSLRPVAFEPLVFVYAGVMGKLSMPLFLVSTRMRAAGVGWDHLIATLPSCVYVVTSHVGGSEGWLWERVHDVGILEEERGWGREAGEARLEVPLG